MEETENTVNEHEMDKTHENDGEAQPASSQSDICRICHAPGDAAAPLFHPCKCQGSIRYVHEDCLFQWLSHDSHSNQSCEICKAPYNFEFEYKDGAPRLIGLLTVFRFLWKLLKKAPKPIIMIILWIFVLPSVCFVLWEMGRWNPGYVRQLFTSMSMSSSASFFWNWIFGIVVIGGISAVTGILTVLYLSVDEVLRVVQQENENDQAAAEIEAPEEAAPEAHEEEEDEEEEEDQEPAQEMEGIDEIEVVPPPVGDGQGQVADGDGPVAVEGEGAADGAQQVNYFQGEIDRIVEQIEASRAVLNDLETMIQEDDMNGAGGQLDAETRRDMEIQIRAARDRVAQEELRRDALQSLVDLQRHHVGVVMNPQRPNANADADIGQPQLIHDHGHDHNVNQEEPGWNIVEGSWSSVMSFFWSVFFLSVLLFIGLGLLYTTGRLVCGQFVTFFLVSDTPDIDIDIEHAYSVCYTHGLEVGLFSSAIAVVFWTKILSRFKVVELGAVEKVVDMGLQMVKLTVVLFLQVVVQPIFVGLVVSMYVRFDLAHYDTEKYETFIRDEDSLSESELHLAQIAVSGLIYLLLGHLYIVLFVPGVLAFKRMCNPWVLQNITTGSLDDPDFHPIRDLVTLPFPRRLKSLGRTILAHSLFISISFGTAILLSRLVLTLSYPKLSTSTAVFFTLYSPSRVRKHVGPAVKYLTSKWIDHVGGALGMREWLKRPLDDADAAVEVTLDDEPDVKYLRIRATVLLILGPITLGVLYGIVMITCISVGRAVFSLVFLRRFGVSELIRSETDTEAATVFANDLLNFAIGAILFLIIKKPMTAIVKLAATTDGSGAVKVWRALVQYARIVRRHAKRVFNGTIVTVLLPALIIVWTHHFWYTPIHRSVSLLSIFTNSFDVLYFVLLFATLSLFIVATHGMLADFADDRMFFDSFFLTRVAPIYITAAVTFPYVSSFFLNTWFAIDINTVAELCVKIRQTTFVLPFVCWVTYVVVTVSMSVYRRVYDDAFLQRRRLLNR